MEVVETTRELQARADAARSAGRRIALVPTMGALHGGHLALVAEARKHADVVCVSIFVNPTQFNEAADFEGYPRELEVDLEQCRGAGVDLVFAPGVAELYPEGSRTWVEVEDLTDALCGASRPGHFRGVTSVVTRLLLAARPHVAVFGQKDYQQLAVIRRMERDLGFGVEILGAPTVREPDGLALSSRNVRLGAEARREALVIVRALDAAEQAVGEGERSRDRLLELVTAELSRATQGEIDYAELRDAEDLSPAGDRLEGDTLLAVAMNFRPDPDGSGADVRLIDNRVLQARASSEDRQ